MLSAKSSWENIEERAGVLKTTTGNYDDFQEKIRIYDIGVSVGIGYIHYLKKKHRKRSRRRRRKSAVMQIDLKYDIGFLDLDQTGRNDELKLKNRVFTIGLSFTSVFD